MNAIEASEMAFVDELDNDDLSFQLDHTLRAMKVLKQIHEAYSEQAMHRLKAGQVVNNYTLDNDLTPLKWKSHATPDVVQCMTGRNDLTKPKLITPTQAKTAGVPEEVIDGLAEKHNKGVKLVRTDANAKANKLFKQTK